MHGSHEHDHSHDHPNGGDGAFDAAPAGIGHNHASEPAAGAVADAAPPRCAGGRRGRSRVAEPDLDLVEAAFVEGFWPPAMRRASCGWRGFRSRGRRPTGARLVLLRVEIDSVTDVGSITPHLGGATFRYDPLPARMVSHRKRLRFVYFDGQKPRMLDLAEATGLRVA